VNYRKERESLIWHFNQFTSKHFGYDGYVQ